ncbi:MAG: ABC transporter permease, partial [Candidatus Hydrogenedentes bacterium]|nr:ABC transporter permease [Candidatus Hydrogenedentota bacterium]
ERRILWRHALRGGIHPVIAYLGPMTASLISGSFVVETIFQIPGLGRFFIEAAFNRDYTLILGLVVFYATIIVLLNLVSDLAQVWLDPRLRNA